MVEAGGGATASNVAGPSNPRSSLRGTWLDRPIGWGRLPGYLFSYTRGLQYLRLCTLPVAAVAVAVVLATVGATRLAAQDLSNLPPPEVAQQLLATRPDLVAQLQAQIAQSGLTPDQIRERLRAAGYPENFLDAYLPAGGTSTGAAPGVPSANALSALNQLGLSDSCDVSADSTAYRFGGMASSTSSSGAAGGAYTGGLGPTGLSSGSLQTGGLSGGLGGTTA